MSSEVANTPASTTVDAMPYEKGALAALTPEERSAIYLNSIRKMMVFFVAVAVVGIVLGIVMALVVVGAIHGSSPTPTGGF